MPQFEPSSFASQIFWLVVCFAVVFLFAWRIALPRISATIDNRHQRIDGDIARAEELASEAEEVLAAYEAELAKARAGAQEQIHLAAEAATAEADKRNAVLTEKLSADANAAHKRIDDARQAAAANVAELVEDIASQAVERLIGVTPDSGAVRKAIDDAVGGRS
ncbi:MAG: F0F1 ATP synthase subunit B' [Rhodospirillaceae bacterium]|jgi:F-type H+-transporting ATPase subunit b|nr:F0F1 ATP synthase subunit B' [Rhodospirillaceae bacterium]MBT4772923.1 F0F1 ATP synthase subunit B' [Rhodospirillaceae bacterium]MBT5358288.1 F0F1 ATP synthase subunit B' [Rhodospirillaceae bacterium]MBT5767939.1 F0F1 ATP synthase subunit B' [Rhodospirillaceae bacterium]MBT6310260.1 F0F1 ATP synthase subunit B' [Rhodospirillaceae bacterium]